jgi:hypothetical protein
LLRLPLSHEPGITGQLGELLQDGDGSGRTAP